MNTIGRNLVITGEITSDEDLTIDGHVRGHVSVRNAVLTIGQHAHIEADVRGARVVVLGRVQGGISASERIELGATADVRGTLSANQIVMADGARVQGGIDMAQRTIAAKVAKFKAGQTAAV